MNDEYFRKKMMTKDISSDFINLNFTGIKLNPDKITGVLGIEPNTISSSNEIVQTASGSKQRTKLGSWIFGFEFDESVNITEQLTYLANYFSGKEKELKEISSWDSVEHTFLDVVINPAPDYGTHSVLLNSKDVAFWGAVGIDICCTFWNPYIFEKSE
jgi:hypothetical protein